MKLRFFIPAQVIFLACTFISGLNYTFGIGQWKAYVQLFGWIELLLTMAGAVLLFLCLAWREWTGVAFGLRGATFLLWLMQFCPAFYALMLGGSYFWYSLFHWACILLGGSLLSQLRGEAPGSVHPRSG